MAPNKKDKAGISVFNKPAWVKKRGVTKSNGVEIRAIFLFVKAETVKKKKKIPNIENRSERICGTARYHGKMDLRTVSVNTTRGG